MEKVGECTHKSGREKLSKDDKTGGRSGKGRGGKKGIKKKKKKGKKGIDMAEV